MGYTPIAARSSASAPSTGGYTPVGSRAPAPPPLASENTAPVDFNAVNLAPTMGQKSITDYAPAAKPDLSQSLDLRDSFGVPVTTAMEERMGKATGTYKPVAQRPTFADKQNVPLGTPAFRQNPIADDNAQAGAFVAKTLEGLNKVSGSPAYLASGHIPFTDKKLPTAPDFPAGISEQANELAKSAYPFLPKKAQGAAGLVIGAIGDPLNLIGEGEGAGLLKTLRGAKDVEEVGNALREAGLAGDIADQYKEIVFHARKDSGALNDALGAAEKLHNSTKLASSYTPVAARAGEEAHAAEKVGQAGKEIAGDNSPKTGTALDAIQTKPELFQFSRRFEPMAPGGYVPEKVAGISKDFSAERLAKNPIDVGTFDKPVDYKLPSGKAVHLEADTPYVISGHNRLEILKRNAADVGGDMGKYVRTTRYAGTEEGVAKAVRDSIMSNVKNKSIKDIELLDNAINGNIDKKAVQEALDFDTKKAKYFNNISDTFRQNGMVDFWNGSVAPKLAALKGLDFGVLQERLNFVERVARKAGEVVTSMTPAQAQAMKHELATKIGDLLSNGKKATLASVEKQITQRLDTIKSGGFKNVQGKSLFGDIVTTSSVQARVPVQAMDAAIADTLKNSLVPKAMRKRLGEVGRLLEKRDPWITDYINAHGGMNKTSAKTKTLLEKLATLSQEDLVKTVATPEMKADALKLEAQFAAHQAKFKADIEAVAKDTGLSIKVGPAKQASRILEKLVMDYKGDVGKIMDGNRATILVDDPSQVAKAAEAVERRLGSFSREIVSTFDKAPGGYERYRMNVATEAGHSAEVQVTTPEMWKAKTEEGGQELYNQVRLKDGAWEAADRKMQKLYANARDHFAARARTSASASAEEISWPSARALTGGKPQPVSMISPKTSPSESRSTLTGVPSTSKNLGNVSAAIPHNITTGRDLSQEAKAMKEKMAVYNPKANEGPKVPLFERKVSSTVGEGVQASRAAQEEAAAAAGKKIIVDKLPAVVKETPTKPLVALTSGKDGKSWGSIIHSYFGKADGAARVHIFDYFRTPEYVLEKVGLGHIAEKLHDAQDLARQTLKKEVSRIEGWQTRVGKDPHSSQLIFRYLDGKEKDVVREMTGEEVQVAREIRAALKEWAKRLKLPEDNQISRYITHIFDRSVEGAPNETFDDPELAAIMNSQAAKSVYNPYLEKRLGKQGYVEDVWRAMDAYVKRGSRKEAMDPVLEEMESAAKNLDELTYNYVKNMSHRINMRPTGMEKLMDSFLTQTPIGYRFTQRPTAFLLKRTRQLFYRGTLGLNFSSALRNLTQGVNTYAKLGEKHTIIGYATLAKRLATRDLSELYDHGILDDALIQDRQLGVIKKRLQKLDKGMFSLFQFAETINRGAAFYGAKSKALARGSTEAEAIKFARRMVRETQFAFGAIDTPVALNDDVAKTLLQLQSYNIKQAEFMGRLVANKDWAGMVRFTAGSVAMLYSIGYAIGMTKDQLIPTFGLGGAPLTSTAIAAGQSFSSDPQTKAKAISQLERNAMTLIPGGAQLRKMYMGATDVAQGKDVTATGKTRFKIDSSDPFQDLQAILFGPSALPQAQTYYDKRSGGGSSASKGSLPTLPKLGVGLPKLPKLGTLPKLNI